MSLLLLINAGVIGGGGSPPITLTRTNIPQPGFGFESLDSYTVNCWVDNTHPSSTDVSNPYGTASIPRKTIPTSLPAGAVVSVQSSVYAANTVITTSGTLANPVIIKAVGGPVWFIGDTLNSYVTFSGTYCIVDGISFYGTQVIFNGTAQALRNGEVTAMQATAVVPLGVSLVIYNMHIHHNGDSERTTEKDDHGILVSPGSAFTWIINCEINNNGGDAIQIGQAGTDQAYAQYVFIKGCTLHDDRENAIDIKRGQHIIVADNLCYSYQITSSSAGEIMIIHNNAQNVWVVNNICAYGAKGIVCTQATGIYVMSNYITDITDSSDDPLSLYGCYGILIYGSTNVGIVNNTVVNSDGGISIPNATAVELQNNFSAVSLGTISGAFTNAKNITGGTTVDQGNVSPVMSAYSSIWGVSFNCDVVGSTRTQGAAIDIGAFENPTAAANTPPVVTISGSLTAVTGTSGITVTNADYTDLDGPGPYTYSWSKISGPAGDTLTNSTTLTPSITFTNTGTYVYRLTVSDGLESSTGDLTIVVSAPSTRKVKWRWTQAIRAYFNRSATS